MRRSTKASVAASKKAWRSRRRMNEANNPTTGGNEMVTEQIERAPRRAPGWRWKRCLGCERFVAVPDVVARWWCVDCVWQCGDEVVVTLTDGRRLVGVLVAEFIARETAAVIRVDGDVRVVVPSRVSSVRSVLDDGAF